MDAQAELTAALAADLDGTFELMVRSQQDRLYSIALRMLGNPSDAEEIAQDAFVRAYRALASYEADRIRDLQLRGWLATIVLNLCRNRARRHALPQVALDGANGSDASASPAAGIAATDPRGNPHEALVQRESAGRWAALLIALPLRYRAAVILRHVDGLSYAEMSVALGRPEGTLKAQVHRGLAMLRDAVERTDLVERQEMTA